MFRTYRITCAKNGRTYYGFTSTTITKRFSGHKTTARYRAKHPPGSLHEAMREFGGEHFFIEEMATHQTREEALDHERHLIETYRTNVSKFPECNGMNLTDGGALPGFHPPETRKRIADALRGKPKSAETRRRMSEAAKRKKLSAEHRCNIGRALKGTIHPFKPLTEDHARKIGEAHRGKSKNEKHKDNLRASLAGRRYTDETIVITFEDGKRTELSSIRRASAVLGIPASTICAIIKGRLRQRTEYHIERVTSKMQ